MHWLFDELGLAFDKANKHQVDGAIRAVLGIPAGAHCPEVWSAIKQLAEEEKSALPSRVSEELQR